MLFFFGIHATLTFLKQYKKATLFFSNRSASIAFVIPAMDWIVAPLGSHAKKTLHPTIIAALKLARKKMDRYYSLTDSSAVYRIAMGTLPNGRPTQI
jgi:hypothetical protein